MEATAIKGIWTERLPKGYKMTIDTRVKRFRIFSPSREEILIVDCPKGIYPETVEHVREMTLESFNLKTTYTNDTE